MHGILFPGYKIFDDMPSLIDTVTDIKVCCLRGIIFFAQIMQN